MKWHSPGWIVPALTIAASAGLACAGLVVPAAAAPAIAASRAGSAEVTQSSGMLNPVQPLRILDTRSTTGGHLGKLGAGATMRLPVLGGGGVPGAGVSAVLLNVTAANATAGSGYLTVFQTGTARPAASTVNYRAKANAANQALVRVGSDGTVSIFNSSGQTDVFIDVEGWVGIDSAPASGQTTTITPDRVLDTRTAVGGHQAPLAAGESLDLALEGYDAIPASGISAVYADVIAVPVGKASGNLSACGSDQTPSAATAAVDFAAGVTTADLVLVPVGADGAITIVNHSAGANVIVDIAGWVSDGDVTGDAGLQPIPATRILDTRSSLGGHQGSLGANSVLSLPVLGAGGVPATGVAAVVLHLTGVGATATTYLAAFPTGFHRAASSEVSLTSGATATNTTTVPVGPTGAITIFNLAGSINVVADVEGWIAAPTLTVTPPSASALGAGALTSADGGRALSLLANANRYAMTTWWNNVYPVLIAAPMTSAAMPSPDDVRSLTAPATGVSAVDSVRRLSMEAFSLATSLATGAYNPVSSGGVSADTATARTVQIISKVAAGHMVNAPNGWGASSQSMMLAAYAGAAGWLLWPQLSAPVQYQVARMVYFEAEYGMGRQLLHYASAAGVILQPGDTGADQDSWFPMADQLATVMMPGNPHAPLWQNTVVRDAIVAWSRPADITSAKAENGATVAAWINNGGSNLLATGDLYNHHRYAPDYSSLFYQNMQDIVLSAIAGVPAPQAVTALVAPVYAAYTTVKYASPPNLSPGGTVYRPGSKAIYYPQGCDWGTGQELPYALADAQTAAFGVGTSSSASYETLHANAALALQQRNADGHTYNSDAEYKYVGREEHVAQQAAQLFLTKYIRDHALASFTGASFWLEP